MKHSDSKKDKLFTRVLPELGSAAYFSIEGVRRRLEALGIGISDVSLRHYMSEAMKKGIVHDAGRGWYSRLEKRCELAQRPVSRIVRQLEKEFPLLDFTCWSTRQINPWIHHLLAKFLLFVNVEKDGLSPVTEFLRDRGYQVHKNPIAGRTADVRPGDRTVVERPLNTHAPRDGHLAPPEAVLVDLFVENGALGIMDVSEFQEMAQNLASSSRLSWGTLIHYAKKRKVEISGMFADYRTLLAK